MRRLAWLSITWISGLLGRTQAVPSDAASHATVASAVTGSTQDGPGNPGPFSSA